MRWKKLGRIFDPRQHEGWIASHASNGVAEHLRDDRFTVYFSSRDANNRSSIGYLVLDLNHPTQSLHVGEAPLLTPGAPGSFDQDGVTMGSVLTIDGVKHLYYLGWKLTETYPWANTIGLARYNEATSCFEKLGSPVLGLSDIDPFSLSYPQVIREGAQYRMFYGSNLDWGTDGRSMNHVIRNAVSANGIDWQPIDTVCLDHDEVDHAFSRPWVVKDDGYKMWYAVRGDQYRIGYAESKDLTRWVRKDDQAGIFPSERGWDSEAVTYPCIFDHERRRYMLYNGNQYGKTGFGLAVLET